MSNSMRSEPHGGDENSDYAVVEKVNSRDSSIKEKEELVPQKSEGYDVDFS